ncbi:MAG: hypothetical protein AB8I08_04810 [Sandaracinaceae bacterium]
MAAALLWTGLAGVLNGCGPSDDLGRSCGGETVGLCGAAEWAELAEPSMEPGELPIADFSVRAQIGISLMRCDGAPAPHSVEVAAVFPDGPGDPDAGIPVRVIALVSLEDGADGDTPGDGRIEADIQNPLLAGVPEETEILLRFTARSETPGGCTSGVVELPYVTGSRRD